MYEITESRLNSMLNESTMRGAACAFSHIISFFLIFYTLSLFDRVD